MIHWTSLKNSIFYEIDWINLEQINELCSWKAINILSASSNRKIKQTEAKIGNSLLKALGGAFPPLQTVGRLKFIELSLHQVEIKSFTVSKFKMNFQKSAVFNFTRSMSRSQTRGQTIMRTFLFKYTLNKSAMVIIVLSKSAQNKFKQNYRSIQRKQFSTAR